MTLAEKITVIKISPWGIGDKVMCINDAFSTSTTELRTAHSFPVAGNIYTIRDVFDERSADGKIIRTSFHLEEIINEPVAWPWLNGGRSEISFRDTNFKAVSIFAELLKLQPSLSEVKASELKEIELEELQPA
jgi:hypothetical protein